MAPTGSPSIRIIRLSPFATSGRNCCTINGSLLDFMNNSCNELRLLSSGLNLNTPAPPLPYKGLRIISLYFDLKFLRTSISHAIVVAGIRSG